MMSAQHTADSGPLRRLRTQWSWCVVPCQKCLLRSLIVLLQALWLANNSSVILFWPYLKASIFTPIKSMMGRAMEFKTTLKGAAAHNASLKVLGPSILIVIINVVTFILGIVNFRVAVNAAQGISLCWLVFNTIPHINLLFYSAFGPGGFMVAWCKLGMMLTTASSALAIILMWLLYPREVNFEQPLSFSVKFMQVPASFHLNSCPLACCSVACACLLCIIYSNLIAMAGTVLHIVLICRKSVVSTGTTSSADEIFCAYRAKCLDHSQRNSQLTSGWTVVCSIEMPQWTEWTVLQASTARSTACPPSTLLRICLVASMKMGRGALSS